jgi:hypothetical protein
LVPNKAASKWLCILVDRRLARHVDVVLIRWLLHRDGVRISNLSFKLVGCLGVDDFIQDVYKGQLTQEDHYDQAAVSHIEPTVTTLPVSMRCNT